MGSGTHGLQTRTSSPPPSAGLRNGPKADIAFSSSPVRSMKFAAISEGGWTMNCRGIVIRCGEHVAHTTLPHFLLVIVSICFVKTRFAPAICKLLAHYGVDAQLVKTWTALPTRKGVASLPAMVPSKQKCKGSLANRTLCDIAIRLPWWQDNIALPSDRRSIGMWWDGWCGWKRSQRGRRGV